MNGVIVQHGFGTHSEMLLLSSKRHKHWADLHRLDYHVTHGRNFPERKLGAWEKIPVLRYWLNTQADFVVWLDADCVVKNLAVDPRAALPAGADIAMIHSPHAEYGYNAGVMFVRVNDKTRKFFDLVWEKGNVPFHKHAALADECRINVELPTSDIKVHKLDYRWNYFYTMQAVVEGVEPTAANEQCYIRAWHGTPPETVLRRMKEVLDKCPSLPQPIS
jgi:hypothetical protein